MRSKVWRRERSPKSISNDLAASATEDNPNKESVIIGAHEFHLGGSTSHSWLSWP